VSGREEDRLDALLDREVSDWYQGVRPRPEFLAELTTRDWNRAVEGRTTARNGTWFGEHLRRLITSKRFAWAMAAGLVLAITLSALNSRTIRAFLIPPEFPILEQQTLQGDDGVREGMTVSLRSGPKVFRLVFQTPVENRKGAEAALTELCQSCAFTFTWTNDRELQVYLPKDPQLPGPEATYTVGSINVKISAHQDFLWEWDVRSGTQSKVADVTGLTAWTISPDGRQAMLARTSASDHPPSIYIMDLDSGARTGGSFVLSSIWHPDGGSRILSSDGRIMDLRGRTVEDLSGDFAQPGPGGITTDWQARGQGQWDLVVRTPDGRDHKLSLPETDDTSPSSTERVGYPLWNLHWSADGSHLLVVQNRRPITSTVFLIDTTSGTMTELPVELDDAFDPIWVWLPDGERFAVSEHGKTIVLDLHGRRVTSFEGNALSWSPRGGYILFSDRVTDMEGHTLITIPPELRAVGWRSEGILVLQGRE